MGGVVVMDGGWPCYYVTYSFPWYTPVPLAIFFPPLVLQRTISPYYDLMLLGSGGGDDDDKAGVQIKL